MSGLICRAIKTIKDFWSILCSSSYPTNPVDLEKHCVKCLFRIMCRHPNVNVEKGDAECETQYIFSVQCLMIQKNIYF